MQYSAITKDIEVRVRPIFEKRQSPPYSHVYTWSYEIHIINRSNVVVQLLYRFWRVVDALGVVREVRGSGVVGQNPVLNPGDTFVYSSYTQLPTQTGFMEGQYEMIAATEPSGRFTIDIPRFILAPPVRLVADNSPKSQLSPLPSLLH